MPAKRRRRRGWRRVAAVLCERLRISARPSPAPLTSGRRALRRLGFLHLVGLLLALDALVDFLAVHGDMLRRIDSDAHLVPFDPQNRDGHVVTNHDGLA